MQMSDIDSAVTEITARARGGETFLVITPNIQHFYVARKDATFLRILQKSEFLLPDGWPVVAAMRILDGYRGKRITGADLILEILNCAVKQGLKVGIMGGKPGVAANAAERARLLYKGLDIMGLDSPIFSSGKDEADVALLLDAMPDMHIDLFFLCIGAPKSEFLAANARSQLNCGAIMCFGAAIDFLAGKRARAPRLVQQLKLEWLYRLTQEPRRLLPRYFRAAPAFALTIAKAAIHRRSTR